jgi:chromate reductase, NAD(P)H dehydrogenase (quinone)
MKTHSIAVLIGSLRKNSYNRQVAEALVRLSPPSLQFKFVEIGDLPLYNQDYDDEKRAPESYGRFRNEMRGLEGALFVTAEYNRSVPAVLKNALDVGSRPYGESVWNGKPAAVVSSSPGAVGGFGANHHLRQCLVFLNMPVLQQPEAYIGHVNKLFREDGGLTDPGTENFFRSIITAYAELVERTTAPGRGAAA